MSNYFDAIPPAVASIVGSCYGSVLSKATGVPDKERDDLENRIVKLADQLTRTFAKALLDAQAGKA